MLLGNFCLSNYSISNIHNDKIDELIHSNDTLDYQGFCHLGTSVLNLGNFVTHWQSNTALGFHLFVWALK